MAMVSCAIAWRDSWSVLPLYFFCTACSSGLTICMAREALICRTNSGMIRVLITTVRPTTDSAQVQPESGSMNTDSSAWNCTMIHATAHSMGYRGFIGLVLPAVGMRMTSMRCDGYGSGFWTRVGPSGPGSAVDADCSTSPGRGPGRVLLG